MYLKLAFAFVMHCLMLHCFRFVFPTLGNYMYNRFKFDNQVEDLVSRDRKQKIHPKLISR